jgi:OOP family OmpA-OmpF porin
MRLKLLAGAAVVALLATTGAYAQEAAGATGDTWAEHGWYGAIDAGAHYQTHMEARGSLEVPGGNGLNLRNDGWDFSGFVRLGYRFTPHVRLELEGGWRKGADNKSAKTLLPDSNGNSNGLSLCGAQTSLAGVSNCESPSGHTRSLSAMANVIFDIFPDSRFDPFIGGGAGLNSVKSHWYGHVDTFFYTPSNYTLTIDGV